MLMKNINLYELKIYNSRVGRKSLVNGKKTILNSSFCWILSSKISILAKTIEIIKM